MWRISVDLPGSQQEGGAPCTRACQDLLHAGASLQRLRKKQGANIQCQEGVGKIQIKTKLKLATAGGGPSFQAGRS